LGWEILLWLLGVRWDRRATLIAALASAVSTAALAETLSPEADACKASGLIALKQKSPQVKDIQIDLDSAKVINAALSRQISIGDFRRRIRPSASMIREQKQCSSSPARRARRQYKIYSDNAVRTTASALSTTSLVYFEMSLVITNAPKAPSPWRAQSARECARGSGARVSR
jgi:hypothetical protein